MCLLLGFPSNVQAVCCFAVDLFLFIFGGGDILAFFIVNGAAEFEVEVVFGCRDGRDSTLCAWMKLAGRDAVVWPRLEWLQTPWSICDNSEVTGEWRANIGRTCLRVNLQRC